MSHTSLTRAYTGRWARGLQNRFMVEHTDAPAGYPQLHHLTAPLRTAAVAAGDQQASHLWAGTGHSNSQSASAAEITRSLTP
jgi:nitronate monooxygenase